MFNKKSILVLFLMLIIAIGTISLASASDISEDALSISIDDNQGISEINDIELSENNINDANDYEGNNDASSILSSEDASSNALQVGGLKTFTEFNNTLKTDPSDAIVTHYIYDDYYCDDAFEGKGMVIKTQVKIVGNGHTFDARGKSEIFWIYDNVVIENLTFKNAYAKDDNGGALYLYTTGNKKIILNNCKFINNYADGAGGAIYSSFAIELNNCTFENNRAKGAGGAIFNYYPIGGGANIANSKFINNSAAIGGAVLLYSYTVDDGYADRARNSYITNSTFQSNTASENGGAIYNLQYLDIVDSQFTANSAKNGGAIYMENGEYHVSNTGVPYNQTYGVNIHGKTTFKNNKAIDNGGAIYLNSSANASEHGVKGIVNVYDNIVFEGNSATNGGALSIIDSNSSIKNAVFRNNIAKKGSALEGADASNCTYEGNIVLRSGLLTLSQSGTYYQAKKLTVKLVNKDTKAALKNVKVLVKFSNGKTVTLTTNANGIATYSIPYAPGTYTATASVKDSSVLASSVKLNKINIARGKYVIKAPTVKNAFKKAKYFKITLKSKETKKALKGVKVKIKVYTGKKFKTFTVKTNKKGIAKINTKSLKKGTHKVVVSIAKNKNYNAATKKSKIKIV